MEWDGLGMEHGRAAWAPRGAVPLPPLGRVSAFIQQCSLSQNMRPLCPAFPGMHSQFTCLTCWLSGRE